MNDHNADTKPRVYDILAKAFTQEDVRTCFALLGRCEHELGRAAVRAGMPHDLREARALRGRGRHGVRAKERRRGRRDRHVRAGRDATDHGATRGRARSPAAGGVRRGSAAEERLVQPGNRPGAAHHCDGRRLSPPAHARAHAGRGTRCIPAGAPRTPAGGDRHSVRSAGPALGRAGESAEALARTAAAPFADAAASRRRGERRETGRRRRAGRRARRPGRGRSRRGRRLPGAGREDGWTACRRRFPRGGCSTTIPSASASRAASRPRSASNT